MITESSIKSGKMEYTTRCGWVDWNHAGPRDDLSRLWQQFPSGPGIHKPKKERNCLIVSHQSVQASGVKLLCSVFPQIPGCASRTWIVPEQSVRNIRQCQEIALAIYRQGCDDAELAQLPARRVGRSNSSFSFEDTVSNLISFYRHLHCYKQAQIRIIAGGIHDPKQRLRTSLHVLEQMEKHRIPHEHLMSASWETAFLFNPLCPNAPNKNLGFHPLPASLRAVRHISPGNKPGQGLFWQENRILSYMLGARRTYPY